MKRFICTLLTLIFIMTIVPQTVFAYKFPNAFWPINSAYTAAVESGDNYSVIQQGNKAIELMLGEPENEETLNVLASRLQKVAETYAILGEFDKSADVFEKFIPYGIKVGWDDSVIIAKAKIPQYRSRLRVFTGGTPSTFYGAKNEHTNGVLFGLTSDGETRSKLPNESMTILYHELGSAVTGYDRKVFSDAEKSGIAIEFALNCPNEGYDVSGGNYNNYKLDEISELIAQHPSVPVFLRFGAEFDVWSNRANPQGYIEAFRYVSTYFKTRNSNVAMVFSPNQVSAIDNNIDHYYPGDEYVDWVGMSAYSQKYFQGNKNITEDFTQAIFKTGINADPVIAVEDVISRYGNRKPIMISESGFTSYVRPAAEDTTDWGLHKMKEFYYYIPMVYPQVKLIAHFDKERPLETDNYALSNAPRLAAEYLSLTKTGRFIQDDASNTAAFAYDEVSEGYSCGDYLNLYTYAHLYGEDITSVTYYVGNKFRGSSETMPFSTTLDLSDLPNGQHTLKIIAVGSGNGQVEKQILINKNAPVAHKITVKVNGEELEFDQSPILYRDRTMVPMRAIFEKLGATVSWDDKTQTASGVKGTTKVSVAIGNSNIFKNDKIISFDVPSFVLNGRTLVPVRAVAESFNCSVEWDGATNTVIITQ